MLLTGFRLHLKFIVNSPQILCKKSHVLQVPGDALFVFLDWSYSKCLLFLSLCLFLIIHSDFLSFCFSYAFHIFLFICLCCPFHILFLYFVPMALKTSMLPTARVLSRFSSPSLKSSYSRNLTLFLYQSDKPFWLGCSASLSTFIWV